MSERWGFDLSMEAVRLMRREAGHRQEVACQKIEGADIEARLQGLADQVDPHSPVYIFLPRDQILYTDVAISSDANAAAEIDAAIGNRTPYAIDDLEIDWEQTGPCEARVAAIARETLDEAATFAAARGLTIAGFSALIDLADFPRLPDFGGIAVDLLSDDEDDIAPDAAPAFSTRRTSEPLPNVEEPATATAQIDNLEPVVKVDDPTPVLQLPESDLPPLDPGVPLPRVISEPRVITDFGAASASMPAASLTAKPPVNVRRRDRAVPTPALAAIAALLSIGIAIIIWSILPTTPVTSDLAAPSLQVEDSSQPEDSAAAETTEPALPALSEVAPAATILDIVQAQASQFAPLPIHPSAISAKPEWIELARLPTDILPTGPEAAPTIGLELDKRPGNLVGIEDASPNTLAPNGIPLSETSRGITIAALDGIVPKTDAISLPRAQIDPAAILHPDPPEQFTAEEDVAILPEANAPDVGGTIADTQAASENLLPSDQPGTETQTVTDDLIEPIAGDAPALTPTELARALPDRAPRARPQDFATRIERQTYGGRTLSELKKIRPGKRPDSAQIEALIALASREPSDLAIETSAPPRLKPRDFDAIVAATQVQRQAEQQALALASRVPDTTAAIEAALAEDTQAEESTRPQASPQLVIPSSASVARQATLENAIRLNRINLVGVYGLASDRRALVRLPSGRYVKVKVGDKVDGGTVASISESELRYTKRGKTIALQMPKG
jgi:type IV pilus biogenesis protein PilP